MARNEELNNSAIGVAVLGGILFIIGFILFIASFMGTARSIENMGMQSGLFGTPLFGSQSPALSSTTVRSSQGSTTVVDVGGGSVFSSNSGRRMPSSNVGAGVAGVLLVGIGGFLVKIAIGMGLVANARPIARWVGDITGQASSQRGRYQAFRSAENIKVRCQHCGGLNHEDARYCSQCGQKMTDS